MATRGFVWIIITVIYNIFFFIMLCQPYCLLVIRIVESFEDVLQILVEEESFIIEGERITVEGKKV